ncbi:MFS transporter [Ruegeria atlantica]|uniref:MFS transporter n=1 Tax=Ruegeria atlantica TaxID=81569 RepID=UPI00147CE2A3|nr:MFS transporter [Ruegeria atlantica]
MTHETLQPPSRNVPLLAGQGAFSVMAWSMASPSVVLTFLAVSMDLPIFLAAALVAIRHTAGTLADICAAGPIGRLAQKKAAIARIDIVVGLCFAAVVLAVTHSDRTVVIGAFVVGIFLIGFLEEVKSLLIIEFVGDNLPSRDRMRVSYSQKAIGGAATIAAVLVLHQIFQDAPALTRHSMVIGFGALCFAVSAALVMALQERPGEAQQATKETRIESMRAFWRDAARLLVEPWFRKYMFVRLTFVLAGLSVPFFALIAAEAHHSSEQGLTALVVSSAAALMVAAPLWRALSGYSNRSVMIAGAAMIAVSGICLIALHSQGLDHTMHLHAVSLFVATVAVTGLGSARTLYFMDIAPKEQRITAQAVSKTLGRLAIIAVSMLLAAIAHHGAVLWAIVAISIGSLLAIVAILSFVGAPPKGDAAQNTTSA